MGRGLNLSLTIMCEGKARIAPIGMGLAIPVCTKSSNEAGLPLVQHQVSRPRLPEELSKFAD